MTTFKNDSEAQIQGEMMKFVENNTVPKVQPTWVTPEIASEWLSGNEVNRSLRPHTVDQYARDMSSGHWGYVGDPIKFSDDGKLLDGQHRLSAVVKSGCTVLMPVITGLNSSMQKFMDKQEKRRAADTLQFAGYVNASTLAAAAKIAVCFDAGDQTLGRSSSVSDSEIEDFIQKHPEMVQAADIARKYATKTMCPPAVVAFASWLIFQKVGDWQPIETFWDAAANKVGLAPGDPVIALTNKFAADRAQRRTTPRRALVSAITRAWNFRRQGKPMTLVRYESPKTGQFVEIPAVIA